MKNPKYIEEYSDIELQIELHRRQAKSIQAKQREAHSDPSKEYAKVESAYVKDGRVEIRCI